MSCPTSLVPSLAGQTFAREVWPARLPRPQVGRGLGTRLMPHLPQVGDRDVIGSWHRNFFLSGALIFLNPPMRVVKYTWFKSTLAPWTHQSTGLAACCRMASGSEASRKLNRLAKEKSPYLLLRARDHDSSLLTGIIRKLPRPSLGTRYVRTSPHIHVSFAA